jgi:hypothetical protein
MKERLGAYDASHRRRASLHRGVRRSSVCSCSSSSTHPPCGLSRRIRWRIASRIHSDRLWVGGMHASMSFNNDGCTGTGRRTSASRSDCLLFLFMPLFLSFRECVVAAPLVCCRSVVGVSHMRTSVKGADFGLSRWENGFRNRRINNDRHAVQANPRVF